MKRLFQTISVAAAIAAISPAAIAAISPAAFAQVQNAVGPGDVALDATV